MAEKITLELPDEVLKRAHENARRTNRSIQEVIARWVEIASSTEETMGLETGAAHYVETPYLDDDSAASLLRLLGAPDETENRSDLRP